TVVMSAVAPRSASRTLSPDATLFRSPRLLPGRFDCWGAGAPSRCTLSLHDALPISTAFAGARRAMGGWGAISGPPSPSTLIEARHGFCRGAPSDGGLGGHLGAPITFDVDRGEIGRAHV